MDFGGEKNSNLLLCLGGIMGQRKLNNKSNKKPVLSRRHGEGIPGRESVRERSPFSLFCRISINRSSGILEMLNSL